jgi:3-hydroxybutyryl-CoA dehydrogenase
MGHGIAQEFASNGYQVTLHDVSDANLKQAVSNIQSNLQMLTDFGLMTKKQAEPVLGNIHPSTALQDVVGEADVVIESVFEDLNVKQAVFRELDRLCPEHTLLVSNTSTLLPSNLALATRRPDKVLVAHYFNPPYLLPLVEIVRGQGTSDEAVATIYDLMVQVGKSPALVQKEAPGFIGNRLQAALLREAMSIVERGIATPRDVDIVIKNGFGRRLAAAGVFEVFEIAGWDLVCAILDYLLPDIESSSETSPLVKERVEQGELGTKTGTGFYRWTPESAEALKQTIAQALVEIAKWS